MSLVGVRQDALLHLLFSIPYCLSRYLFLEELVKHVRDLLEVVLFYLLNLKLVQKGAGVELGANLAALTVGDVPH